MDDLIAVTTTPTSLSHDEYEIPRDIKTVRVNRIKAKHALSSPDKLIRKRNSVFGQLQQELQDWNGIALRRSYVAKGHGGQKRAFKVKVCLFFILKKSILVTSIIF
jgi:endonuclease III